jgi:hypothetical protein
MADPLERRSVKPPEDDPGQPPVPEGEPSRTAEETARGDLAIRGAAAGGALDGSAGYAGGAATGVGGAVGMRQLQADERAEDQRAEDQEEGDHPETRNMAQADA